VGTPGLAVSRLAAHAVGEGEFGCRAVEELDVGDAAAAGGQLVHRQVPQERLEVTLDDAAVLAQRRSRPAGRGVGQPTLEQVGDRPGSQPGIPGLLDELVQLSSGVPSGAVNGLGCPPLFTGVGVDTEVDAQLPAARSALTK
jgi:hypothetical protein